jgi:hypothetical protein
MATPNAPLAGSRAMMDHVMRRDDTHKISRCYAWPMKLARLALGSCAALAMVAMAFDTEGRGKGGSGGRSHAASGGSSGQHHHHHHHGGTRVFIGAGFVAWPAAYYGYGPGYYYPPAAVMPAPQYWYYCTEAAGYYPYVQQCPGGWELVIPTMPPHIGY